MKIKDIMKSAKDGDVASREFMYNRYSYIVDKFYEQYKDKLFRDKLDAIYKEVVDEYFMNEKPIGISKYIHKRYTPAINRHLPKNITVEEQVSMAKEGNEDSRKVIYDRYKYIADKFYNTYKGYITKEEIYRLYGEFVHNYFDIEYPLTISAYIHHQFELAIREYLPEKITISSYIKRALTGDDEAREKLINHYSSVVMKKAEDCDYLEYEELVQYGMIKLIEIIDAHLERGNMYQVAAAVIRGIDIYFDKTLKHQVLGQEINEVNWDHDGYIEYRNLIKDQEFMTLVSEMEIEDLIQNTNLKESQRLCAMRYFVEGLQLSDIGKLYGCSKQRAHQIVNKATERLEYNFRRK